MNSAITWGDFEPPRIAGGMSLTALSTSLVSARLSDWEALAEAMRAIERLEDDWDDLGSSAPTQEVSASAFVFFDWLRQWDPTNPPDRILASPTGSYIFEWQPEGMVVEAEIQDPWIVEFSVKQHSEEPEYWQLRLARESAKDPLWEQFPPVVRSVAA